MHVSESEALFRKQLRAQGLSLKELSAGQALRSAVDFWRGTDFEGLRPDYGDGLIVYFELMDRGRGAQYEFGVNRVFREKIMPDADYQAWLPATRLGLFIGFKPTIEVFQLKPAAIALDIWNKRDSDDFISQVEGTAPFRVVASLSQHSSKLQLADCTAPWGDPVHATQGLSWAVA